MDIDQTFQQAIVHHQAGEIEDAERLYRSILHQQPRHTNANYRLAVLLKQAGQATSALPFFKAALESNPNQGQYWLGYIETLMVLEKYVAARRVLEQGQLKGLKGKAVDHLAGRINLLVDRPSARLEVSKTLNPDQQHVKKGLKTIEKGDHRPQHRLGSTKAEIDSVTKRYAQGQVQETLNELEVLIKKTPNESRLYNMSGECYKALGQLDTAVKFYQQALVIEPGNASTHNNLANLFKKLGQLNTAIKHYEQAIKIKPDYAEANNNYGNTLQLLGDSKAAVKYFKRAFAIKPKYAEAYFNLANTLNEIGQLEQAVKHYEQALALEPDFVQAHSNLGVTLNDLGQFDVAVKRFEQALALEPNIAEVHNNLGLALQELGQLDAAVNSYEQALIINPGYAQAWRNLYFTAQPLTFLEKSKGAWLRSFKNRLSSEKRSGINFALLDYQLNSFKPQTVAESYGVA